MNNPLFGNYFVTGLRGKLGLPVRALACELSSISVIRMEALGYFFDECGRIEAFRLGGKFWWTRGEARQVYPEASWGSYDNARSTQEIFDDIAAGFDVCVMGGPFDTRDAAHYALDLAWESPE